MCARAWAHPLARMCAQRIFGTRYTIIVRIRPEIVKAKSFQVSGSFGSIDWWVIITSAFAPALIRIRINLLHIVHVSHRCRVLFLSSLCFAFASRFYLFFSAFTLPSHCLAFRGVYQMQLDNFIWKHPISHQFRMKLNNWCARFYF